MDQAAQLNQIDRSQNIDGWNVRLYFWSRNPKLLFGISLIIILVGLGIAWAVQKPLLAILQPDEFKPEVLKEELAKEKPDAGAVLEMLPKAAEYWLEDVPADQWIIASKLTQTEKLVANAYWTSAKLEDGFEPSADLLYYAFYVNPLRYANELIGDHYIAERDFQKAVTYYQREAKFPEAAKARVKLLDAAIKSRDRDTLRALADNPDYVKEFRPEHRLYFAAKERRWAETAEPLKELQARLVQPVPVTLAAIAGLVWLVISLQAIQPIGLFTFRLLLPPAAVVAGIASSYASLIAGLWMEEMFGLRRSDYFVDDFLFYMLSQAPCAELAKLAFFIPFVPILLFRRSRLEMLVTAGCVGLGYAVWDSLAFFKQHGPAVAFPQFLTVNFFHLALTGLIGIAFCEMLRNPIRGFFPFIGTFLLLVTAHGGYFALGSGKETKVMVLGSMVIYMLVALWYFRKLYMFRHRSTDQINIGATFLIGISLLAASTLVLASREIGFIPTLATFAVVGFGMVMVSYMFYWQLGEGMSAAEEAATPYYR